MNETNANKGMTMKTMDAAKLLAGMSITDPRAVGIMESIDDSAGYPASTHAPLSTHGVVPLVRDGVFTGRVHQLAYGPMPAGQSYATVTNHAIELWRE